MNEQYPNLSWAFINNPDLKTIIFEKCKIDSHSLCYLETLITELRYYKCEGIQEKIKNLYFHNFLSILSELEFALIIAKDKEINRLKLLPDDYFSSKSPDILYQDASFTSYIEVTRIYENPYISDIIMNHLRFMSRDLLQ
jgi:hypothetical protein